jgi:signal-transduction protein with cAMP-binding, CBS, and nucleotidyltransferase domain
MWKMRIHRIPICRKGILTGIVSTLDICQALAQGRLAQSPPPAPKTRRRPGR